MILYQHLNPFTNTHLLEEDQGYCGMAMVDESGRWWEFDEVIVASGSIKDVDREGGDGIDKYDVWRWVKMGRMGSIAGGG